MSFTNSETRSRLKRAALDPQCFWGLHDVVCLSYAQKVNRQFQETNRRQDETDTRVECNTRQIRATEKDVEELRQELRRLNERMDKDREAKRTHCVKS